MEKKPVFSRETLDNTQSPDRIDEYIRVSTPRAWILALAMLAIVAGVLVWGFTGSIPKTAGARGVVWDERDGDVFCLMSMDVAGPFLLGHEARITLPDGSGFSSTVKWVSEDPISLEELGTLTRSDWRTQTLWGESDGMYQYALEIGVDGAEVLADRTLVDVSVVLSDVKPIAYVFN